MRLAEEVEQIGKHGRGDETNDDGPAQKLLVPPAVRPSHPGQKVVAMFFFALPRPKHKRPLVRVDCNNQTPRLWQPNIRREAERNTKHQIPSSREVPNLKHQTRKTDAGPTARRSVFEFGDWNLELLTRRAGWVLLIAANKPRHRPWVGLNWPGESHRHSIRHRV